jgi:hypothetical protein
MKIADQASNMNAKAKLAQASIETSKKNESAQNVGVESEPEVKLEEVLLTLPSILEPQASSKAFSVQPLSTPQRSTSMAAPRSEGIVMNQEFTVHVPAPDAQAKAKNDIAKSEIELHKSRSKELTATSAHSIMKSYSELITELLAHITNLETLQADVVEKTSSLITTTKAQQQEIQALKLAVAIKEQEEAEKIMIDVTKEIKVKYDEAELRNIELMYERTRLEKENKGLKEMVKRFEKLYGGIEEAEELDG